MYPLKANQELYSKNIWEIDTDSLAEELFKKMTLEEVFLNIVSNR